MLHPTLNVPREKIREFCQRWLISELAMFGSSLRPDFGPDSDVDVLISFTPEAHWTLLDHVRMELELTEIFGRQVDLVSRRAVEQSANVIRRRRILESAETLYAA
jgi:predicted nucleotidyltransferase